MKIKLAASFIIVALASFLLGWSFGPRLIAPAPSAVEGPAVNAPSTNEEAPLPDAPPASRTVSVMLDFGDGTVKTYENVEFTEGKTLFDVMLALSQRGDGFVFRYQGPGQYGILVEQIGDKIGGTDNHYWLWWENNRMGQVASDAYVLKDGDVIEWKFINLKS